MVENEAYRAKEKSRVAFALRRSGRDKAARSSA